MKHDLVFNMRNKFLARVDWEKGQTLLDDKLTLKYQVDPDQWVQQI